MEQVACDYLALQSSARESRQESAVLSFRYSRVRSSEWRPGKRRSCKQVIHPANTAAEFASRLQRTFAVRPELKRPPLPETIVCGCRDVTFASLKPYGSWRAAKLQTRCGMGPCQGRICASAAHFLFGWNVDSVRPPVFPTILEKLAAMPGNREAELAAQREDPNELEWRNARDHNFF